MQLEGRETGLYVSKTLPWGWEGPRGGDNGLKALILRICVFWDDEYSRKLPLENINLILNEDNANCGDMATQLDMLWKAVQLLFNTGFVKNQGYLRITFVKNN